MPDPFSLVVVDIPVSVNAPSDRKKKFKDRLRDQLKERLGEKPTAPIFDVNLELHGRIYYFNHEAENARDIHNIIKPLFDALEGYVYNDDKQIKYFEGFRLDMEFEDDAFDLMFDTIREPALLEAGSRTTCLIEIGTLPSGAESAVTVRWLT